MSRKNNGVIGGLYGGDARGLYGSRTYGQRNTMIYGKPPSPFWPKVLLGVVIVILIILCIRQFACGGILPKSADEQQDQQQEQQQEQGQTAGAGTEAAAQPEASTANGTLTLTAVGDCTLGTDVNFSEDTSFTTKYAQVKDPAYFFQRVVKYTGADDLTIANFEGTLTTSTEREDKEFAFKAPAKYAKILTEGSVEAVNLANNHSYDYGADGYQDTKDALDKYEIAYVNADLTATYEAGGIKVGLLGINALNGIEDATTLMETDIEQLREDGCDLVVGSFHWGTEGSGEAEDDQVTLAHAAVDAGCDLVLGTHPHVLQGIELYHNRYILYSLGNFCFGGNDSPREFSTMMWQQTFTFENGQLVVSEETLSDVCVIPCRVSSSSTTLNDYQPLPLGGDDAKSVIKLLNGRTKTLSSGGVLFNQTVDDDDRSTPKSGVSVTSTTE